MQELKSKRSIEELEKAREKAREADAQSLIEEIFSQVGEDDDALQAAFKLKCGLDLGQIKEVLKACGGAEGAIAELRKQCRLWDGAVNPQPSPLPRFGIMQEGIRWDYHFTFNPLDESRPPSENGPLENRIIPEWYEVIKRLDAQRGREHRPAARSLSAARKRGKPSAPYSADVETFAEEFYASENITGRPLARRIAERLRDDAKYSDDFPELTGTAKQQKKDEKEQEDRVFRCAAFKKFQKKVAEGEV